jgi:thymidylate synthase (FAD)
MEVKLISTTQPVPALKRQGIKSPEDLIVYCARVSNPSNQLNSQTAPKLIQYLIKHKHWSPFEMVDMCVEIKTSRAIAAQILRHRSFSFQEFSQRYAEATALEPIQWRMQGATNRQVGDEPADLAEDALQAIQDLNETALEVYGLLTEQGIAKECARMILPLTTQTTLYMKGSIRSWIHYVLVRATQETQKEHRDIALAIKKILKQHFPDVCKALDW